MNACDKILETWYMLFFMETSQYPNPQAWLNKEPLLNHTPLPGVFPSGSFHTQDWLEPHPDGQWPQQDSLTKALMDLASLIFPVETKTPISRDWHWWRLRKLQLAGNILLHVICENHLTSLVRLSTVREGGMCLQKMQTLLHSITYMISQRGKCRPGIFLQIFLSRKKIEEERTEVTKWVGVDKQTSPFFFQAKAPWGFTHLFS